MKEKVKYFILGVLACAIISTTVSPVLGAVKTKMIEAVIGGVKIYIDDVELNAKDAKGNPVYPIITNGTTYLPVRAVGEALGKAVLWDPKTSSVYIGKHDSNTPVASLVDMEYFDGKDANRWRNISGTGEKDNLGDLHLKGATAIYSGNRVYLINQKYTKFTGNIALIFADRDTKYNSIVKIYGDDQLIYTSPVMTGGTYPVKFDIDVTGIIQLKVEWDSPYDKLILSNLDFYSN